MVLLAALAWGREGHSQSPRRDSARVTASARDTLRGRAKGDTAAARDSLPDRLRPLLKSASDLDLSLTARLEAKAERTQNERCAASALFSVGYTCRSAFTPAFEAQFGLKSNGGIGDRVALDVDYDTQREFDGSNQISIAYTGRPTSRLQRLEVGNVSFNAPASRFISAGIPSGNFGVQAIGRFGNMQLTAIAAQQKGNVVRDQSFTIGRRTTQAQEREIEDHQIEPRRFFWTVDPQKFGAAYPNIDILDARQMQRLAAALPPAVRPARLLVYRLILGGQPPNPNGPRFQLLGDPLSRPGQVYELLRENVDYYVDPSLLWLALVRPLALNNERLVVAYAMRVAGRDTVIADIGGTPDLEYTTERAQYANLLWDPQVTPDHPAFRREIRNVYRLGGEDVRRESVRVRIVAGTNADQEKPPGGSATSYLQLFGLAQLANPTTFDWENRLWPRPNDPNFLVANLPGAKIFRDQFIVFPSLEPFARRGLASPDVVAANDTIYRTPSEYLYSPQRPQSYYRLRVAYETDGGGGMGTIALNSVQIRPGSERLTMDGRLLVKGVDYDIDYELGRVQLLSADTLIARERHVVARYEENPLFATVPTSIFGLSSTWALRGGSVNVLAISQSQRSTFNRPPLGFEPQASVVAGVSANYGWQLPSLARLLGTLPRSGATAPAAATVPRLDVQAEFAVSRPRQNSSQQAYIESFEGEGGTTINLLQAQWQYSSQPAIARALGGRFDPSTFDTTRATTLAYQNSGVGKDGKLIQFTYRDIDPNASLAGVGFTAAEPILWMTMYPLGVGGLYDAAGERYRWQTGKRANGRRWRSIHTVLGQGGGAGIDLSRGEQLEFWTLVDTAGIRRQRNPTLVLDFGDVSENSVTFAPETLSVQSGDSTWRGRKIQGYNRLGSERDPFSRAFNADVNDRGLPGDVVDSVTVFGGTPPFTAFDVPVCSLGRGVSRPLGDAQDDCTVRNGRLDEEDIDQDNALNFTSKERELERVRRFIVDLSSPASYARVGKCGVSIADVNGAVPVASRLCWVQVRLPFNAPDDSTAGGPLIRRVRALRLTVVSGLTLGEQQFSLTPVARLRVVGASWLKRADRTLSGIAGTQPTLAGGTVIASLIGTQDRDSTRGIFYDSPPGVSEVPDQASSVFGAQQVQVNERSLRLLATALPLGSRAEAYFRFPEGQRNLMGYRELRMWVRGRGRGWGPNGDLQAFVKIGRDADNFYLYRTEARSGSGREAWGPEVRVRFDKFYALRAKLQNAFLQNRRDLLGCTALDSALIARSGVPVGTRAEQYAACEDGYVVYTVNPGVTPPNLAAVQELAVGMVRVDSLKGIDPPIVGDTLELWADDIRLADVVNTTGFAGEVTATLSAGDFGSFRVGVRRRDPNFRQINEAPSFLTNDDLDLSATWRLDRFLPASWGYALPLTVAHRASGASPEFLTRSDIPGASVPGLRQPRAQQTTYTLSARRATPLTGSWLGAIVNNLIVDGAVSAVGNRTEFQNGRVKDLNVGFDFSSGGLMGGLPVRETGAGEGPRAGWGLPIPWGGAGGGRFQLQPSMVRLSSALVRTEDSRAAYLKPAVTGSDSVRLANGQQHVWRTVSTLEFQPLPNVTARWDASTVHDLREYGDSTANAIAATLERSSLGGVDIGLERERTMAATLTYSPVTQGWLRPRLALASTYTMLRDPNNRAVVIEDSLGPLTSPHLSRRVGNTQVLTAATTLDPLLAVSTFAPEGSRWRKAFGVLRPIDVSFSRNQLSSFDGLPVTPGLGFQLGLGGIDSFRSVDDHNAASAGASSDLVVANALAIPGGLTLTNRLQRTDARHWSRREAVGLTQVTGEAFIYPDVALRWSGHPRLVGAVFSSLGATARALVSRQSWTTPGNDLALLTEQRESRQESYPFTATAVTAYGDVSLSATYAITRRVDSLPGSVARRKGSDLAADVSKAFALPQSWRVKSPVRTRISWQESLTQSFVENAQAVGALSRLTDNGRRAFNFNADTDVAENMTFSLQASRVVTFDRNFNRRFVQTVITAVFQLQFFSGGSK
ncbi:MAG: cell surface protein SprA [Gemmatimonadaceae bacterium]|nr:cell surface protein SprA [Gemmatimonadaceae bacterium]